MRESEGKGGVASRERSVKKWLERFLEIVQGFVLSDFHLDLAYLILGYVSWELYWLAAALVVSSQGYILLSSERIHSSFMRKDIVLR